jgi:hypothetical protein
VLLAELAAAKHELVVATEALRAVEGRLRSPSWDAREPFMARRGRALHREATQRFGRALDGLHALLVSVNQRLPRATAGGASAQPRGPRARRLLAQIRQQLRYLQRAFDGGSMLLASALASFGH